MPARYLTLSLSAAGIDYLDAGQWETSVGFRFLHSDRLFIGTQEQTQLGNFVVANLYSFDLRATYGVTKRISASLTVPVVYGEHISAIEHDGIHRHTTSAAGLGDIRLVTDAWLLDPDKHPRGNVAIGVGMKAPSGDYDAKDTFYRPNPQRLPVDIAIQPGDGGWGIVAEMQAYDEILPLTYLYAAGLYLSNPRDVNGVQTRIEPVPNSVPDQYMARAGVSYTIWPKMGLALSLGGRIDGIPVHDLIGGSNGYRRPGYAAYVEPGINLGLGKHDYFSVSPAFAVARNEMQSVADKSLGRSGGGGLAAWELFVTWTHRF